jgi:AbrB family looped-hinge helix DNA binding protein
MATVTLSSKGQIVIPAPLRKKLGLKQRARLRVEVRGGKLVLEPEAPEGWESLEGSVKAGRSLTKCLEEEHKREVEREQQRSRRASSTPGPS